MRILLNKEKNSHALMDFMLILCSNKKILQKRIMYQRIYFNSSNYN